MRWYYYALGVALSILLGAATGSALGWAAVGDFGAPVSDRFRVLGTVCGLLWGVRRTLVQKGGPR